MILSLDQLTAGQTGRIHQHLSQGAIRQRLFDLGLFIEQNVQLVRLAPLGDPIEIALADSHIALRKEEASTIQIELMEQES